MGLGNAEGDREWGPVTPKAIANGGSVTPKAFANLSPGLERSDNPGISNNKDKTLKGFANRRTLSGLDRNLNSCPRVLATLEPRAEISQRLRRYYEDSLR
jgi:hypothetical protein